MKRALAAACGATLLIISAHRLPAPISEEKTSPPEAPSKPAKHKASDSADSSSIRRFEGTWRATGSSKSPVGNTFSRTQTLIIKNGTADYIGELTGTLASGKRWTDLPAPYNSSSPLYTRRTNKSTDLKTEGSNLRIRWQGQRLTDWAPKTIPIGVFKNAVGQPSNVLLILSGDHLIDTNGKQSQTYTRVR
jgi:hypothetical protein